MGALIAKKYTLVMLCFCEEVQFESHFVKTPFPVSDSSRFSTSETTSSLAPCSGFLGQTRANFLLCFPGLCHWHTHM